MLAVLPTLGRAEVRVKTLGSRPGHGGEGADEAERWHGAKDGDGQGMLRVLPWWRCLEDVGVSLLGGQAL